MIDAPDFLPDRLIDPGVADKQGLPDSFRITESEVQGYGRTHGDARNVDLPDIQMIKQIGNIVRQNIEAEIGIVVLAVSMPLLIQKNQGYIFDRFVEFLDLQRTSAQTVQKDKRNASFRYTVFQFQSSAVSECLHP